MEIFIAQQISTKKKKQKALWDQDVHPLQYGRNNLQNLQIFLELEPFPLFLGLIFFFLCFNFLALPLLLLAKYPIPRPRWKNQPDKIMVRNLDFGRTPETSHWSIICRYMDRWLPWCATNIHFPMLWGADINKNGKWNMIEYRLVWQTRVLND